MSYLALARKWRPAKFNQVVGQSHVVTALENALQNNKLHHAYLFSGTRGVGKTSLGRLFSKGLNCETGITNNPCGVCTSCVEIDQGRHVDLLEIDAASRTKVEDTRELLDNVQYKPTRGRFKIYLIDEVHMLSRHSFNALLKTLEEPPEYVKFLLATTDPQKLPVTILSRCLQFHLKPIQSDDIHQQLSHVLTQEGVSSEPRALSLISHAADGSMRDALSLSDQAIALGNGTILAETVSNMLGTLDTDQAIYLLEAISHKQPPQALQAIEKLARQGVSWDGLFKELSQQLHRIAMVQTLPATLDKSLPDAERIELLSRVLNPQDVQLFYQMCLKGRQDLAFAPSGKMAAEMLVLRMLAFRPAEIVIATPADATQWQTKPLDTPEMPDKAVFVESQPIAQVEPEIAVAAKAESEIKVEPEVKVAPENKAAPENKTAPETKVIAEPKIEPQTEIPQVEAPQNDEPLFEPAYVEPAYEDYDDNTMPEYLEAYEQMDAPQFESPAPAQQAEQPQTIELEQAPETSAQQVENEKLTDSAKPLSTAQQMTQLRHQLRSKKEQLKNRSEQPSTPTPQTSAPQANVNQSSVNPASENKESISNQDEAVKKVAPVKKPEATSEPKMNAIDRITQKYGGLAKTLDLTSPASQQQNQGSENQEPYQWTSTQTEQDDDVQSATPTQLKKALEHEKTPEMTLLLEQESAAQDAWSAMILQLPITPLIKQMALNAWYEQNGEQIILHLRSEQAHLIEPRIQQELQQALSNHLQMPCQLDIQLSDKPQDGQTQEITPLELRENLYQQKLQQAVDSLNQDPNIQQLQQRFAAEIEIDSVRPL